MAALFGFAYFDRYYRWRDCFNELGRCYDPQTGMVYVEQAGLVWITLLLVCLGLVVMVLFLRNRMKQQ
ncbi:hypothetical protein [Profundibacter sp.]|uniref:hypothetical protein n=1 Tax=Profundibacter sp. TaxID=3101071 RepID=UPI003D133FBB